jgi:4-hydroxy-2-oxoheptanedioate aldolase
MALTPREKADRVFGEGPIVMCFLLLPSPEVVEMAADAGFQAGVIDLEHGVSSIETAQRSMIAMRGTCMRPIVRLPERSAGLTKRLLDAGAAAVVIPYVETVAEARAAVADARYAPEGRRGLASYIVRASRYGREPDEYIARWDETGMVIIMIETRSGVEAAQDIAAIDGVDGLLFGPSDYGLSVGRKKPTDPEIADGFEKIRDAARGAGKLVGSSPFGNMSLERLFKEKCDLVTVASDVDAIRTGFDSAILAARSSGWA